MTADDESVMKGDGRAPDSGAPSENELGPSGMTLDLAGKDERFFCGGECGRLDRFSLSSGLIDGHMRSWGGQVRI